MLTMQSYNTIKVVTVRSTTFTNSKKELRSTSINKGIDLKVESSIA